MKRRPARSLLEQCVARGGVLKGSRVAQYTIAWAIVWRDLDREPTVSEYAEWWKESERTAYKHQAEFREAFPEYATPAPFVPAIHTATGEQLDAMLEAMRDAVATRRRGTAGPPAGLFKLMGAVRV
jgi:hypothetical protein